MYLCVFFLLALPVKDISRNKSDSSLHSFSKGAMLLQCKFFLFKDRHFYNCSLKIVLLSYQCQGLK